MSSSVAFFAQTHREQVLGADSLGMLMESSALSDLRRFESGLFLVWGARAHGPFLPERDTNPDQ